MAHTIQTYPSLSLMSLQESPQASHFFNAYQTRLLPTTDHIPNQKTYTSQTRILKHSNSKESSLESIQPRAVSTKKAEVNNPPALKNTPANEKFLKFLKGIREERVSSEQRLQKTVENFTKLEAEPKEKVKWKKMVETGQYIGSRGNEKKDIRLSGRALSREKNFQSMRKKMTDLKYEMKSCNVIKHLTSNPPPDVSNLAQPILPFFDGRPARPAQEITLIKDMSSLDIEDVKHELVDVHFDTIDSPVVPEKDLVMTYNKEQLKKLKGGINYMNRWIIKNRVKSPGESHRSNKVLPNTSNNNIREVALGSESREKSTEELATNFLSPLNSTPSRRKSQFKKPRVQERDQKVDPHDEFLKRIGLSDMDIPKGNYFATSANKESIKTLPYRIEITSEDEGPRMFNHKLESPSSQIPSPYMIPERFSRFARERIMSAGLNESDMSKTLHENDNSALYKTLTLSQTTSAGLKIRTSPMNRSYFSPKSSPFFTKGTPIQKKNAAHVNLSAENIQMMSKYNQISNECDSSVKLGSEIQMNLQKDYAVVTEKLAKMNQVQREDWFIDLQIKNDIFAEMQNTPGVTTKLRKKVSNKFAQNKNM